MASNCWRRDCARTTPSASADPTARNSVSCWTRSGHRWPTFSTLRARSGERRAVMYRVDIIADLNDEDETGYLWTFLDEARDLGQITPGALVVAGDEDTATVCQVVDLAPAGDGTIVHLRLLPGRVDDYRQLVERALAS